MELIFGVQEQEAIGAVAAAGGALIALVATLRYVKSTEDDTVDGLRVTLAEIRTELAECRRESQLSRIERNLQHRQIDWLFRVLAASDVEMPEGFPTV